MVNIIGRDRELRVAENVLERALSERVAKIFRIIGPSGNGKTTIARALEARARAQGWVAAFVSAHRIQSTLPLVVARRIARTVSDGLGPDAAVYASGLEGALSLDAAAGAAFDANAFESALFQFAGAILMDRPLFLILDDAQWTDPESKALLIRLVQTFADRALAVCIVERVGEATDFAIDIADASIVVRELDRDAAARVARSLMPETDEAVIDAVLDQARGRAIDIVTIASLNPDHTRMTEDSVAASMRAIIAEDLARLKGPVREFLQICALVGDPIDYALLTSLWPDERVIAFIDETSGRYLVQDGEGLRIVHMTVAQSIRETIPVEIPYRKRIIAALERLPNLNVERLERIVEQAAACGDTKLERSSLWKLADEASRIGASTLAASAMERALALSPASPEELVPTYTRLTQIYHSIGREFDAMRVAEEALHAATAYGISEGLGGIAASLIIARWNTGDRDGATADLQRYRELMTSPQDSAHFATVGEFFAMNRFDESQADAYAAEFEGLTAAATPMLAARHHTTRAYLALRKGDETAALEHVERTNSIIRALPPIVAIMPRSVQLVHLFRFRGASALEKAIADNQFSPNEPVARVLTAHAMLAQGAFADLADYAHEHLPSMRDPQYRRILLSALTAGAAFQRLPKEAPPWAAARAELALVESGSQSDSLMPIASAWLIPLAQHEPARAKKLLAELLARAAGPVDQSVLMTPIVLVLAAKALAERDALKRIADGAIWSDKQPLNLAHQRLARGAALAALGSAEATEHLKDAIERFLALGSPFFSNHARELLKPGAPESAQTKSAANNTTRREREIAALVAEGLTNRQIAEKLVLSERTVEGHIANLFAKVNVSSRTQLAAWYLRFTNSVA